MTSRKYQVSLILALGLAAAANAAGQAAQQSAPAQSAPAQSITLIGCIQSEADYRRAHDAGRGGAAGTGIGVGNEFVLIDASAAPAASSASAARPGDAATPTGTSGAAAAYELTGSNEGQASRFVGRRVEVTGTLKPAETSAGQPTGGATAGAPPRGVDVASSDLKLRELEVASFKETTANCPAPAPR